MQTAGAIVQGLTIERVRHPEVTALEFSHLQVDGATSADGSPPRQFHIPIEKVLQTFLARDSAEPAALASNGRLTGVEAIFLTGGRAKNPGRHEWTTRLSRPVVFAREAVFGGALGGLEFLRSRGLSGWVADLGNSQLKLAGSGRRWIFPREWKRLPPVQQMSPAEELQQGRRLREFIALKLQMAMTECGERPRSLMFALPTSVSGDGTPEGRGNYVGMRGARTLLPEAMAMAGLADLPLLVINDAELAALSARLDVRLAGYRKILVLTLGFGIGVALVSRSNFE